MAQAPAAPAASDVFEDRDAGYSVRIPSGFTRLSEDENREVFRGISQHFGKQVGERALRRPPAWFKGPADPKNPKMLPPSMAIGYTDLPAPIDPTKMQEYKDELEREFNKRGEEYGEINIRILRISGVDALRIEREMTSPVDKSRSKVVNLAVPGGGRRYDVVFNFSPEQEEQVEPAIQTIVNSFKVDVKPTIDPATQNRWLRIALFTIGGFLVGIVLSFLLRILSGAGETIPDDVKS